MAAQNYEVAIYSFGDWPRGTVLPEFVVLWAFGDAEGDRREQVKELVDRGTVRPTRAEVARETLDRIKALTGTRVAKAKADDHRAEAEAAQAEITELRARLKEHDDNAEAITLKAERAERRAADLSAEIADYVEKNAHLGRACEEHQAARERLEKDNAELKAKVAELTAELEAATAPAA